MDIQLDCMLDMIARRIGSPMRGALIALLVAMAPPVLAADLVGQASIIDGDTLEIHGTRIRLWGIDAPESDQLCRNDDGEHYRCGQKAANDLDAFIARRPVECVEVDRDQYRRAVAVCTVNGIDLADWLVRNGYALDWPRYSKGNYDAAQDAAKRAERGMWAAVLLSHGAVALAEERAEHLLAVPLEDQLYFASGFLTCRHQSGDLITSGKK
jgi:endonuclease YncB( thermonuclease family)